MFTYFLKLRARPPDLIKKKPFIDLPVSSSSSLSRIVKSSNHFISSSSLCNNHFNKKLMANEIDRHESIILAIYLIELDKVDNESNQSLSSLYLSNIPQEKIYPLPIHKGKIPYGNH
ncbi:unnamed protein product [Schistosoma spindalis]|nr:unnamed protein product [Schistosoma spindale]